MADEIKLTVSLTAENGQFKDQFKPSRVDMDQAAVGSNGGVVEVGTSEENLAVTDITTEGIICLQNLDTANYVDYGQDNSSTMQPIGRLLAGEIAVFRMKPGETLRMQANLAAVKVRYLLLEN